MKRALDIALSGTALLLLSPLLLLLGLLVRADSAGPSLYRQQRVGRGGRLFWILKFRSMAIAPPGDTGPQITVAGDQRVTRLGRVLRKTKLDELPQLWNVLAGEMSLVGPRPEVPRYVALYSAEQRRVLALRPGITDPASVAYLDEELVLAGAADPEQHYRQVVMPHKIQLNLEYANRATLVSDIGVILKTLARIRPARPEVSARRAAA